MKRERVSQDASEGGASEGGASEADASEGGASEGGASEGGASEADAAVWLNTREASARLGMTLQTLYRFIDEGELVAYKFGRVIRLKQRDVDSFIERCRIQPGELDHLHASRKRSDGLDSDGLDSDGLDSDGLDPEVLDSKGRTSRRTSADPGDLATAATDRSRARRLRR